MEHIRLRARLLATIRAFFAERGVMEVETPLLSAAAATDPYLESFSCRYHGPGEYDGERFYLQTSPEFAMKRLLAAGSGPIYQICKSFRNGEFGRHHNPEFTMLEWYRPGFDHHLLMDEVEALIRMILGCGEAERVSYGDLFQRHLGFDPHTVSCDRLQRCARLKGLDVAGMGDADRDTWLTLLLTHLIEPSLGAKQPLFVYDFPASQAMLARVREGQPAVAERFELYVKGVELANGFHELADAGQQRRRFEENLNKRSELGMARLPMDSSLLQALVAGLPDCAGVALGMDRLLMLVAGADALRQIIAFPFDRA